MNLGFDQPLYLLPFDHRGSFQTKMFGWTGKLTASQTAEIVAAKQVISDGFKAALAAGVPKQKAGILVDEQFGAAILGRHGSTLSRPLVRPKRVGRRVRFRVRRRFRRSTSRRSCRVSARFWCATTPEGDRALNRRQAARLRRLSGIPPRQGPKPVHVRTAGATGKIATGPAEWGPEEHMISTFRPR